MNDLISRKALIAEYDRVHIGPPGGARKLIEEAPSVKVVEIDHARETLAELIAQVTRIIMEGQPLTIEEFADYLIANGVTVTEKYVGKWISIKVPPEGYDHDD